MNKIIRESGPVIALLVISGLLVAGMVWALTDSDQNSTADNFSNDGEVNTPLAPDLIEAYNVEITNDMNPIAEINTNQGMIEVELFEDQMPITAGNFVELAESGFYDGVKFHRVIEGFMIQGGDPNTKTDEVMSYGTGGPGYSIADEHIDGELLTNVRGTISMANRGPESGGSQFFINLADNQNLDFNKPPLSSKHPVFGRVISGMDVVDRIGRVETNNVGLPQEPVVMESVTIRREG
jgi:cyclophilin family peptidyl-prolyl cis-trans isomerase